MCAAIIEGFSSTTQPHKDGITIRFGFLTVDKHTASAEIKIDRIGMIDLMKRFEINESQLESILTHKKITLIIG